MNEEVITSDVTRAEAAEQKNEKRVRVIELAPEALLSLLIKGRRYAITDGIDANTKLVKVHYEPLANTLYLAVQNELYEMVEDGQLPPAQHISIRDIQG